MGAPYGNKYAVGNNGGRPPIYSNAEDLIAACNEYFEYILGEEETATVSKEGDITPAEKIWKRRPEPATITGLSLFLGFESRQSLFDYCKRDEFSYITRRAMQRVEHGYELNLHGERVTGSIFALKNMGWADKSEVAMTQELTINWDETKTYPQQ